MRQKKQMSIIMIIAFVIMVLASSVTANAAVKLNKTSISIVKGKTYTLKVTGIRKKAQWSTSNKKIATVSSKGQVKGISGGKCNIYAKVSGKKYTCKVVVKQPVTKIALNKDKINLDNGKSYTLKITVAPKNASNKAVTWKISNPKVAVVSAKGKITGKSAGTTVITVTAKDGSGKKASCKVTVKKVCKHKNKYTERKTKASCSEKGYTGDIYCIDCGALVKKGKAVPKTAHSNFYTGYRWEATCSEEGYTGDTYCGECYELVKEGKTIPKTAHSNFYKESEWEATCSEEGYTGDTYCGECYELVKEGQIIPKTAHSNFYIEDAREATDEEDGYTGDKVCGVCYEIVEYGTVIPMKNSEE